MPAPTRPGFLERLRLAEEGWDPNPTFPILVIRGFRARRRLREAERRAMPVAPRRSVTRSKA